MGESSQGLFIFQKGGQTMGLAAGDIKCYLTGGAGNTDPNASLGGDTSATEVNVSNPNNLFNKASAAECAAGSVKYRAVAIKNTHGSAHWYDVFSWLGETTSAKTSWRIAKEVATTQSIANEDTPPVGLSFSTPTTKAAGISHGDIEDGQQVRVWFERTITAGATVLADTGNYNIGGDNGP